MSYNELLRAGFKEEIKANEAADRQHDEHSQIPSSVLILFQFLIKNICLLYT